MHSPEVEDNVWPDLTASPSSSRGIAAVNGRRRGWAALWWGLSCAVHLALLVGVGWWSEIVVDTPQTPAIRVAFIPALVPAPAGETAALLQSRPPERRVLEDLAIVPAPLSDPDPIPEVTPQLSRPRPTEPERAAKRAVPEPHVPELLDLAPAVKPRREPRAALTPPRATRSDLPTRAQKPPASRLPQTAPTRELPSGERPVPTAEDAALARLPAREPSTQTPPTPGPPIKEPTTPPASLPRATGVRYGQNPIPAYPFEARRRGWEGTVVLMVEILESGRPERVTIKHSSGHSVLDEAASGAVGRWTFIPAQQDGKPMRSVAEVPIVFSLRAQR